MRRFSANALVAFIPTRYRTGESHGFRHYRIILDHDKAKELIVEMCQVDVDGISFSAGEPFLYFNKIAELVKLCRQIGIYTKIFTKMWRVSLPRPNPFFFWSIGFDTLLELNTGLNSSR